jgi:hypothetical protein
MAVPARIAAARRALCHDLAEIGGGAFRPGNLARLLPKLDVDRARLERVGDHAMGASVARLERAIRRLRSALLGNGDVGPANRGMLRALRSKPNC